MQIDELRENSDIWSNNLLFSRRKKTLIGRPIRVFRIRAWRWPTLTWGNPTLPSARLRFTSEFGMGSGGSNARWPPGNRREDAWSRSLRQAMVTPQIRLSVNCFVVFSSIMLADIEIGRTLERYMVKPHGQLVLVSFIHYWTSTPSLSTWWSSRALQWPRGSSEI